MRHPIGRLEGLAVLAVICAAMIFGLSAHRLHPDESHWIGLSAPFEAFVAGRFSDPIWRARPGRHLTAPVTYYVIGVARRLGGWTPDALNAPYRFDAPLEVNAREGRVPLPGLLAWSRGGVAVSAALGVFLIFLVLTRAAGRPASYCWLALALVNPYLRATLQRAMNEGVLLGWIGLVVWAGFRALEAGAPGFDRGRRLQAAAWLAIAGAAAGAAAQTKLNGGVAAVGLLVMVGAAACRGQACLRRRAIHAAAAAAIVIAASTAAFVVLNPTVWPDPVGGTVAAVRARDRMITSQIERFTGDAMPAVSRRILVTPKRVLYDNSLVPGSVAWLGLAVAGALLSLRALVSRRPPRSAHHALAALVFVGWIVAAPAFFTPLDWPRYYLLPVVFSGVAAVFAVDCLGRRLARRLSGR